MQYDQCRTCRRLGQKLFLKGDRCFSPKCAIARRAYAPGPQRKRRGGAPSEYKKSLTEKQSLKKWYGVSERQFKRYVNETLEKMGKVDDVSAELIRVLEKRLDNVIFRLGFAKTRAHARQLVTHSYFLINGKPVNIPSYQVKKEDTVAVKENKKAKGAFKEIAAELKKKEVPAWLSLNIAKLEAKTIGEPSLDEVKPPAEISLIFEFYSR
jgi:small subunit ribosomal protein S4